MHVRPGERTGRRARGTGLLEWLIPLHRTRPRSTAYVKPASAYNLVVIVWRLWAYARNGQAIASMTPAPVRNPQDGKKGGRNTTGRHGTIREGRSLALHQV